MSLILERNFVKLKGMGGKIVVQDYDSHTGVQNITGEWAKARMIKNS